MTLPATCLFEDLDEVKPWLKLPAGTVQHDAVLEDLAQVITEEIEAETGRVFVEREVTEQRIGDGSAVLQLAYWPVASVTLTLDDEAIDTDAYVVSEAGRVTLIDGSVFTRGSILVATYEAGYARASLSARVKQLARDMLKIRYDGWISNSSGVTSMSQGQVSMVPLPDWPYAIKNALDQLKREANP